MIVRPCLMEKEAGSEERKAEEAKTRAVKEPQFILRVFNLNDLDPPTHRLLLDLISLHRSCEEGQG